MGSYCVRGSGASEIEPRRTRTWCKVYRKHLNASLKAHEADLWYAETLHIVTTWPAAQELVYVKAERWTDFMLLSPISPYLKYQIGAKNDSQMNLRNLFDMLKADFHDQKNPIASLISGFLTMFMKQYAAELSQISDAERAYSSLVTVSALILKFIGVLVNTAVALYTNIGLILQQRRQDLEGLFLALIVHADVYRLLINLSVCVQSSAITALHNALTTPPTADSLGIDRKSVSASLDHTVFEIKALLTALIGTENLHHRREVLNTIHNHLQKWPEEMHVSVTQLAVVQSGLEDLPGQLYLTRLLLTDCPEALEILMQGVTGINNSRI